jgi:hypothetical protein
METKPMTEEQYEEIKNEIQKAYFFLLGQSNISTRVIELMKVAALANIQRRYEAGESW